MAQSILANQSSNRPWKELRAGNLKVVIWANQTSSGIRFNTELRRVYRDDNEQWQETTSLGRDDLLAAKHLLAKAYDAILDGTEQQKEFEKSRQASSNASGGR